MKRTLLIITLLLFTVISSKAINDETDTATENTELLNLIKLIDSSNKPAK
jgi:hypothetical protein